MRRTPAFSAAADDVARRLLLLADEVRRRAHRVHQVVDDVDAVEGGRPGSPGRSGRRGRPRHRRATARRAACRGCAPSRARCDRGRGARGEMPADVARRARHQERRFNVRHLSSVRRRHTRYSEQHRTDVRRDLFKRHPGLEHRRTAAPPRRCRRTHITTGSEPRLRPTWTWSGPLLGDGCARRVDAVDRAVGEVVRERARRMTPNIRPGCQCQPVLPPGAMVISG